MPIKHTPPPKKLVILSFSHKIDWHSLSNIWLWFIKSEVRQWKQTDATRRLTDIHFEDSLLTDLKTVHRKTVLDSVNSSSKIYLTACLRVCLSVCHKRNMYTLFGTETSPSQNNPNWSTQRKYVVMILDHPAGNSGGVSASDLCCKGFELNSKICLPVCLSTISLLSPLL